MAPRSRESLSKESSSKSIQSFLPATDKARSHKKLPIAQYDRPCNSKTINNILLETEKDSNAASFSDGSSRSTNLSDKSVGPDGGYGWVIVGCSFLCIFTIDGVITTYALLLPELINSFETTPAIASFGNSLIIGTFLLMGMPTSIFINKYGCRPVAFIGACIAASGFVISSTATSIWVFLSSFGIVSGIGVGMVYLPSTLMVNSYFNRKRGIAQGIVTSGSGVGILVLAPLMEFLLEHYGWRGSVLIYAGIMLQLCVCALLMRPLYLRSKSKQFNVEIAENIPKVNNQKFKPTDDLNFSLVYSSTPDVTMTTCHSRPMKEQYFSMQCIRSDSDKTKIEHTEFKPLSRKDIFYSGSTNKLKVYDSYSTLKESEKYMAIDQVDESDGSCSNSTTTESCDCSSNTIQGLFDKTLLTSKAFFLLTIGAMLTQMGQYIPMVFLGDYALQIGLDRTDVSVILAVFGVVNTLSRLLAGALTNVRKLTPLLICNIGTFACAVTLFLFSLCTTFWTLCVFAICLAVFVGFFPPMQPLMVLDYLGLDRLTSAFGLMTFAKGPAAIFGPPLAGNLYQMTQSYGVSNAFAGGLFFLSAVIQSLVPCCQKPELTPMDQELNVEPLENDAVVSILVRD